MEQEEAEDIHHEYRRGGGAPTRGMYTLVVYARRIASKNIYRRERRKKIRIGDAREPSRPTVLIWPLERDDTASQRETTSAVDPGMISRERTNDFISILKRSVLRDSDTLIPRHFLANFFSIIFMQQGTFILFIVITRDA